MLALIPKLLGMGLSLIGVLWLGLAGAWLMHRYDGLTIVPAYHLRVWFLHWTLEPPKSLWPEYVLGQSDPNSPVARQLGQCNRNVIAMSDALSRQNAATAAISAAGAQARARAEAAIRASRAATAAASENEARILAAIKPGEPECERYREVDSAFAGSL